MWRCKECGGKVTKIIDVYCGRAVGELNKEERIINAELVEYEVLDWFYKCNYCGAVCDELKDKAKWIEEEE